MTFGWPKIRDAQTETLTNENPTSRAFDDEDRLHQLRAETQGLPIQDSDRRRYLRATSGNIHHASKRLRETQAWRDEEQPHGMYCTACAADPHSHYMHPVAYDLKDRPAIYSCLALANNRVIADNKVHMLSCFESAIAMMEEGVEQWVWMMDFHGFGVKDADPRLAKIFLHISAAHYPERLAAVIVIDAPAVFSTLWRAVLPFIDPVTKQKIRFVSPQPKTLQPLLLEFFDEETTDWLVEEVTENRAKSAGKVKSYDFPALARWAAADEGNALVEAEAARRRQASSSGKHDNLGSPGMLRRLRGNNKLLLPQIRAMASLHKDKMIITQ